MSEEESKVAPGQLALIQALVNTQYGQGRRARVELTSPEQLRGWLVAHGLLVDGVPVTEGDLRRVFRLREALRGLLRSNNEIEMDETEMRERRASAVEELNHLARNAPLTVHFHQNGLPTLEPDIAGVDGAIARLVGIVFTAMIDGIWSRLKVCRNAPCQKAFYDTSKNRSGTWCSMAGCGSRLKARTYRGRHTAHIEG
jgi:predicted RNA-binding Zn ribbon-like protein